MFAGESVVQCFESLGITHAVWVPDSELGQWESALNEAANLELIRVCREGEAYGVAAGLMLGGKKPIVVIQCTGFFEAGDALRNVAHDMGLPVFVIVGYRGYYAAGGKRDTAAVYLEPIVSAWQLTHKLITRESTLEELAEFYRETQERGEAAAALLAESKT